MRTKRRRFTAGGEPGAEPAGVKLVRINPVVFQLGVEGGAADLQPGGGFFDVAVDLFDG